MKCPVCGVENRPDSIACDCGYESRTHSGGSQPPFKINDGAVLGCTFLFAALFAVLGVGTWNFWPALILLLVFPHFAVTGAWILWSRSSSNFRASRLRTRLLLSALIACSLNLTLFWLNVIWLHLHQTHPSFLDLGHRAEDISNYLNLFATVVGIVGVGPGRLWVVTAAIMGWGLWITGHIGVL